MQLTNYLFFCVKFHVVLVALYEENDKPSSAIEWVLPNRTWLMKFHLRLITLKNHNHDYICVHICLSSSCALRLLFLLYITFQFISHFRKPMGKKNGCWSTYMHLTGSVSGHTTRLHAPAWLPFIYVTYMHILLVLSFPNLASSVLVRTASHSPMCLSCNTQFKCWSQLHTCCFLVHSCQFWFEPPFDWSPWYKIFNSFDILFHSFCLKKT